MEDPRRTGRLDWQGRLQGILRFHYQFGRACYNGGPERRWAHLLPAIGAVGALGVLEWSRFGARRRVVRADGRCAAVEARERRERSAHELHLLWSPAAVDRRQ